VAEVAEAERGPATVWITGAPHAKLASADAGARAEARAAHCSCSRCCSPRSPSAPCAAPLCGRDDRARVGLDARRDGVGRLFAEPVSNLVPPLLVTLGFAATHVVSGTTRRCCTTRRAPAPSTPSASRWCTPRWASPRS
jgi:hypothetical protein